MEEASESSKESSHSAHTNGMNHANPHISTCMSHFLCNLIAVFL